MAEVFYCKHSFLALAKEMLVVKNLPEKTGDFRDMGLIPGSRKSHGEEMETHSSILAWRIPWTEKSGGL